MFKMAAMASLLNFRSERFQIFFYLLVTQCFLSSFESIGFRFRRKEKIDFEDGEHLGFSIGTNLATYDLLVTQCFLPSFMPIGLLVQEQLKIDFKMAAMTSLLDFQSEPF